MPYRFNLTFTPSSGHDGPLDSVVRVTIDEHIHATLAGLSAALSDVLPVLSDEEYSRLPTLVQRHFLWTQSEPRQGVEHNPGSLTIRAGDNADEDINAGRAQVHPQIQAMLNEVHRAEERRAVVAGSAGRAVRGGTPVTRSRRPVETFRDIEPEDQ